MEGPFVTSKLHLNYILFCYKYCRAIFESLSDRQPSDLVFMLQSEVTSEEMTGINCKPLFIYACKTGKQITKIYQIKITVSVLRRPLLDLLWKML